jgi:hypothetical protein
MNEIMFISIFDFLLIVTFLIKTIKLKIINFKFKVFSQFFLVSISKFFFRSLDEKEVIQSLDEEKDPELYDYEYK